MTRWIRSIAAFLFSGLIVGPLVWLTLDRAPPIILISGEATPAEVYPGGKFHIRWLAINPPRVCPGILHRSIVDSEGVVWTLETAPAVLGENSDFSNAPQQMIGRENTVPRGVALGTAIVKTHAEYVCNFTQRLWPIGVIQPEVRLMILGSQGP